ncbi:MAG: CRISPR-associated endonuclease Cas2 [Candidatus Vogelbacteria bacterium]|nr:CRISPR-associated endonuclease Cas2 [Candidatus Vogelbacteria bacterium]
MDVREKKADLKMAVLAVVATSGLLLWAAVAPNTLQLLKSINKKGKKRRLSYINNQVISKLITDGLLENKEGKVNLTPKGEIVLGKYELGERGIKKPKKWDGKYHLIIFDIKERRRKVRDELRLWLERLGFVRLQNSVWVYPYDCQEVVALLKADLAIGKDVIYLTSDYIENDIWLKRKLGLN